MRRYDNIADGLWLFIALVARVKFEGAININAFHFHLGQVRV